MDASTTTTINRRNFILGGALAGAGALFGLSACSPQSDAEGAEASDAEAAPVEVSETVEADFVVVGGGMAGFCAALKAAEGGCKVVLLEKNSLVGGSTQFAEGVYGNETEMQEKLGYDPADPAEILAEEVEYSHGIINSNLFKDYLAAAPEYIKWLTGHGVSFETVLDAGSGKFCLHIYEGGNGSSAIKVLQGEAEGLGVDIRTGMRATELLMEGDAVVGVRAEGDGTAVDFKAPTVCLATGGIGSSEEMASRYTVLDAGKWEYIGNAGQEGDGITMVEATQHGPGKPV